MKRVKLLRAQTGEYQDRSTGETKMGYTTIGSLLDDGNGKKMLKIDSIPVGFTGWVYFGDLPSQNMQQAPQRQAPQQQAPVQGGGFQDMPDDEIPF